MPTDGPIATPIATQKGIFPATAPTMAPIVTPKEAQALGRWIYFFLYSFSSILLVTYHSGHSNASFPFRRSWHRQYH
jgi:hypothetical protein